MTIRFTKPRRAHERPTLYVWVERGTLGIARYGIPQHGERYPFGGVLISLTKRGIHFDRSFRALYQCVV